MVYSPEKDEDRPEAGTKGVIISFHKRDQCGSASYRQFFVQTPLRHNRYRHYESILFISGEYVFLLYTSAESTFLRLLNLDSDVSDNQANFEDFPIDDQVKDIIERFGDKDALK